MADVTVMHSVVIKATGSTATEMFVFAMMPFDGGILKLSPVGSFVEEVSSPRIESAICPDDWVSATPLLIVQAEIFTLVQAIAIGPLFIQVNSCQLQKRLVYSRAEVLFCELLRTWDSSQKAVPKTLRSSNNPLLHVTEHRPKHNTFCRFMLGVISMQLRSIIFYT